MCIIVDFMLNDIVDISVVEYYIFLLCDVIVEIFLKEFEENIKLFIGWEEIRKCCIVKLKLLFK